MFPVLSVFAEDWKINDSKLSFSIETRFNTVKGKFTGITGKLLDYKKGKAIIEVDISTIDTGNSKRDDHLKDADFFDIAKFPKAIFEFLSISVSDDPSVLIAKGKLTIKGISKEYEFPVTRKEDADSAELEGGIPVNRKDFGLEYDSFINPIKDIALVNFSATLERIKGKP
jgi:polyisoprenoid-binding protein YceI